MKCREREGEPEAMVAACTAAHGRLASHVEQLTDGEARRLSLLPDWTVGHVLTHLARNADGILRMFAAAEQGAVADQYEGGVERRAADIERGADRDAAELVADVVDTIARLERTWAETSSVGWSGRGRTLRGELPIAELPYRRWLEVELHHIDLGSVGGHEYTFADLPADFVGLETRRLAAIWASRQPMGLTTLPPSALGLASHDRLAWLAGRLEVEGLAPAGAFG